MLFVCVSTIDIASPSLQDSNTDKHACGTNKVREEV